MNDNYEENENERTGIEVEFIGRPERYNAINNDDILNIIIAINTSKSVDEFISVI